MQSGSSSGAGTQGTAHRPKLKRCVYCPRTFGKEEHLRRHQRTHTGERPFQCIFCHRQYARSDVLQRHLKAFHSHAIPASQVNSLLGQPPARRRRLTATTAATTTTTAATPIANSHGDHEDANDESIHVGAATGGQRSGIVSDNGHDVDSQSDSDNDGDSDDSEGYNSEHDTRTALAHSRAWATNIGDTAVIDSIDPSLAESLIAPKHHALSSQHMEAAVSLLRLPNDGVRTHNGQDDSRPQFNQHTALSDWHTTSFAPDGIMEADIDTVLRQVPNAVMTGGQDSSDDFWLGSDVLDYMDFFRDVLPSPFHAHHISPRQSNTIPRERYSQVQRLWPTRKSFARSYSPNLWDEVVGHQSDNILSDPSVHDTPSHSLAEQHSERQTSSWMLDEDRRLKLMQYAGIFALPSPPESSNGQPIRTHSQHSRRDGSSMPPTRLLNLALSMAFRRFKTLVPFIHQPTFSVHAAPDSLVFPLCLLGLVVLDSEQTKAFTLRHFGEECRRCYNDLTQCFSQQKASWKTIVALASALVLVTTFSVCGESARRDEAQAEMLCHHTISLAQLSRLFTPDVDRASAQDVFLTVQARFHAQKIDEEGLWKAWARIESTKRIITFLVMTDTWWAYSVRIAPSIQSKALCLEVPCSTELFTCRTALVWRRILSTGHDVHKSPFVLQVESPAAGVTAQMSLQSMCPTAMSGVLCMIWIYVLELQDWQLQYQFHPPKNILASNITVASLTRVLSDVLHRHNHFLNTQDANCITLWHFLNMSLFAHMTNFEIAAGRKGAESARVALDEIAVWGQTKAARRACLHAADIYKSMSRRRTGDGTMFHSESALFSAALVVGLWVFTAQNNAEIACMTSPVDIPVEPYELLDEVDWTALHHSIGSDLEPPPDVAARQLTRAAQYIEYGGDATWSGISCRGGYDAAKTILLEFASLLEEVGKWNAKRLCQILMTLSDSLLNVDD